MVGLIDLLYLYAACVHYPKSEVTQKPLSTGCNVFYAKIGIGVGLSEKRQIFAALFKKTELNSHVEGMRTFREEAKSRE